MKKHVIGKILLSTTLLTQVGLNTIPVQAATETSKISVSQKEVTTYGGFKLGYWNINRFVLEGQAGLTGKILTAKNVTKTLEILDYTGSIIKEIKATNTNWYNKGNYDGYQVILNEDVLKTLAEGDYRLQLRIKHEDDNEVVPISEERSFLRGISDYVSSMSQLNGYNIGSKYISFKVISNQLLLNARDLSENEANPLRTYGNSKGERIYDGWLNTTFDYSQEHTKNLILKDKSEKEVYRQAKIATWDINAQFGLGMKESLTKSGFQVIVPLQYNSANYTSYIEVVDNSGKVIGEYKVYPERAVTAPLPLTITSDKDAALQGETIQFTANLGNNTTWKVAGNKEATTTIDAKGKLTIADKETATQLTVTAKNGNQTATKTIEVGEKLTLTGDKAKAKPTESATFTASDKTAKLALSGNTSNETTIDADGKVTLGLNEQATSLSVTATSGKQTATQTLTITRLVAMDKINYDGLKWQVLKVANGKAMIVTETLQDNAKFNLENSDGNVYKGSNLEKAMTKFYSEKLTKIKQYALPVNLPAVSTDDADTTDKTTVASSGKATAFALSTADVLTTWQTDESRVAYDSNGRSQYWWLRSPYTVNYAACNVSLTGYVSNYTVSSADGFRPAVYVNLSSEALEEWTIEGVDEAGKGSTHQLTATTTGKLSWSVSGNKDKGTTIDMTGKLTVGVDETATQLTLTATNGTQTAIKTIKVMAVEKLTLAVDKDAAKPTESVTFTASDKAAKLALSGNTSKETTIDAEGKVTLGLNEQAESLIVTATSGKQTATQTLNITPLVATDKINYDGYRWQVMKIANGKALLVTEATQGTSKFNPSKVNGNDYKGSTLETAMTVFYNEKLLKMKQYGLPVNLPTVATSGAGKTDLTTIASSGTPTAFALSTADVSTIWVKQADRVAMNESGKATYWWLRSPNTSGNYVNYVALTGTVNFDGVVTNAIGFRPAVYVNLSPQALQEWVIEGVDEAEKGSTHQLIATTTDKLKWSVSGNKDKGTTIDTTGKLTVGADETATKLNIAASNNTQTAIKTIDVVSD